jgi:CheY-like chemotaxis protein/HPt (histidine-containing phosphotransfer) domain-containing protein
LDGLRVLVVDDNRASRDVIERMLQRWNAVVDGVESASQAMEFLDRVSANVDGYDVVVVDAGMPRVDGFQLVEQMRSRWPDEHKVILMLPAWGMGRDVSRCKEVGVDAHLTKPSTASDLLDSLMIVLGERDPSGSTDDSFDTDRGGEARSGRPLRVLLAEDNPVNQRVAAHLLKRWGHETTVVGNGRQAIEAVESEEFDVVLMDIQMPEISGLEATAAIRKKEAGTGRHIPIIAMTAHAMKGDRERCLDAGMDDYVSKPVNPPDLQAALDRFCPDVESEKEEEVSSSEDVAHCGKEDDIASIFDMEKALARTDGSKELLGEVLDIFEETSPELLREIRGALAAGDAEKLSRSAHSLKGAAGSVAAGRVFDRALELEELGKRGDMTQAVAKTEELEDQVRCLREVLTAVRKEQIPCES